MVGHPLDQAMGRYLWRDADIHSDQCMVQSIRFVRLYVGHPGVDASTTSFEEALSRMSGSSLATNAAATAVTTMTSFQPQRIGCFE